MVDPPFTSGVPLHPSVTKRAVGRLEAPFSGPVWNPGVTIPALRLSRLNAFVLPVCRSAAPLVPTAARRCAGGAAAVLPRGRGRGRRHVPTDRGGLLVAWHPNGVVDPAVILARCPGRLVFGARDGLLKWPLLGALMRGLGTVPIYRAQDDSGEGGEEARREANRRSLEALATEAAAGSFTALFPEGQSHDLAHPTEIRTGAARLYGQALALAAAAGAPVPALLPVGLHYDDKATFRSRVLVVFHAPLDVPADLRARLAAGDREAVQELTDDIETALDRTALAADDWTLVQTMHRARTLMRAEAAIRTDRRVGRDSPAGRALGAAQIWRAYHARLATHPAEVDALLADVRAYDRGLRALGLTDANLDRPPRVRPALAALLTAAFVLAVPLLALGFAVNGPPHRLLKVIARRFSKARKDTATVKLLVGLVLYPAAWAVAGGLAAVAEARLDALPVSPLAAGLLVAVLSALGAVAALWFSERWAEALRAVRVRLTRSRRREALVRLREARTGLHDRLVALREGLDLPASVEG